MRLFRELRTCVGEDHLFSQSGEPIVPDPPFIDDDEAGKLNPYAKPYIIGYALSGLPDLAEIFPSEPGLLEVVNAVADFQASAQDPIGGWRYPPSSIESMHIVVSDGAWLAALQCNRVPRIPG